MAIKFTDTYVASIARAHFQQGEQVVARTAGVHKPWWSLGIAWFFKTYLLIASAQRVLVLEHRRGLLYDRLEKVEALSWSEISSAKMGGLLTKNLRLVLRGGRTMAMKLTGMLGPVARNSDGARALVAAWERGKATSLPATSPGIGTMQVARA